MPRGVKEAPAVRQAQTAADAIRAKAPELARSPDVMEVVQKGDRMMQHARKLEEAGKHAEAFRYREAARLNFQSLERLAKIRGWVHTGGRALGYASLPIIALDAYGMTTQAMEEGPGAVGRQIAEGAEETGRAVGRVLLPKAAEDVLGLDEPGTLRSERVGTRQEQAAAAMERAKEEFIATPDRDRELENLKFWDPEYGVTEKERQGDEALEQRDWSGGDFSIRGERVEPPQEYLSDDDFLQQREQYWNLTDPTELAKRRSEAVKAAMAPKPNPNLTLPSQK
jgi:hypothetical protein